MASLLNRACPGTPWSKGACKGRPRYEADFKDEHTGLPVRYCGMCGRAIGERLTAIRRPFIVKRVLQTGEVVADDVENLGWAGEGPPAAPAKKGRKKVSG